jgi:hypothetical protein
VVPRMALSAHPPIALPEAVPRVALNHRLQRRDHLGIGVQRRPRVARSSRS